MRFKPSFFENCLGRFGQSKATRKIQAEEALTQLNRILASSQFKNSKQQRSLLEAIVRRSLSGQVEYLKELVLAQEVLRRPDYDPQRDTLVRVEVASIRRKLGDYYKTAGSKDPLRIEIPSGHYAAAFSRIVNAQTRLGDRGVIVLIACGVALLSVASALLALRRRSTDRELPSVPEQITFDTGWTSLPAISKDGSAMVYSSDRAGRGDSDIWIEKRGGPARRLTTSRANDTTPDISFDGKKVVFRSTRSGDGIFLIDSAAQDDDARLVGRGYSPRFSPDGRSIAFAASGEAMGHILTISDSGGGGKRLDYGILEARYPVWSPDGTKVVFAARAEEAGPFDLWIASVNSVPGSHPVALGVAQRIVSVEGPRSPIVEGPQDWKGNQILFTAKLHETSFLYEAILDSSGGMRSVRAILGPVGAAGVRAVSINKKLTIFYGMERRQTNIWMIGRGTPKLEQVTNDNSLRGGVEGTWPELSANGEVMAYITERSGKPEICVRNLDTGEERLLGATVSVPSRICLDTNGEHVVFSRGQGSTVETVLIAVGSGLERVLTTSCPVLHDLSHDRNQLLCSDGQSLFSLNAESSSKLKLTTLSVEPGLARFSPDGRWVAYCLRATPNNDIQVFVQRVADPNGKVLICREQYGLALGWSTGGDGIYFWSTRDGHRCLYFQALNREKKTPFGLPVAIIHCHSSQQHYPTSGGTLAIASRAIAMTLTDQFSNIWRERIGVEP